MGDPRVIPHDIGSEEAVIGACLLSPQAISDVMPFLLASDFYKPLHQAAWDAVEWLWRRGEPVDAVTLSGVLRERGLDFDDGWLFGLQGTTPAISRAKAYAERVVRACRLRAAIMAASEITDAAYTAGADPEEIHSLVVSFADDARLLPRDISLPEDLMLMRDFRERFQKRYPDDDSAVIIPSMLKARWRALFISTEGSGKSVALRQIATFVANGFHPFVGLRFPIVPRRVLIIDAENPEDVIEDQAQLIDDLAARGLSDSSNLWIWHVEGGLNLRLRKDQAKMERVLAEVKPELVTMGPVYKLYANGNTDLEQSATEFVTFLDGLRARYGFALLIEHHAPKGMSGARDLVPFGSVVWQRWPEFGFKFRPFDRDDSGHPHRLEVGRFRGDRVKISWPKTLVRGTKADGVPWSGIWPDGAWTAPIVNREAPAASVQSGEEDF